MATRMPISLVRCATEYDLTPSRPITASTGATPEKTPTSSALNRSCAIDWPSCSFQGDDLVDRCLLVYGHRRAAQARDDRQRIASALDQHAEVIQDQRILRRSKVDL